MYVYVHVLNFQLFEISEIKSTPIYTHLILWFLDSTFYISVYSRYGPDQARLPSSDSWSSRSRWSSRRRRNDLQPSIDWRFKFLYENTVNWIFYISGVYAQLWYYCSVLVSWLSFGIIAQFWHRGSVLVWLLSFYDSHALLTNNKTIFFSIIVSCFWISLNTNIRKL